MGFYGAKSDKTFCQPLIVQEEKKLTSFDTPKGENMYIIMKEEVEKALRLRRKAVGKLTMQSYLEALDMVSKMSEQEKERLIKKHNTSIEPTLRKHLLDGTVVFESLDI